jgi:hypothetical protein
MRNSRYLKERYTMCLGQHTLSIVIGNPTGQLVCCSVIAGYPSIVLLPLMFKGKTFGLAVAIELHLIAL